MARLLLVLAFVASSQVHNCCAIQQTVDLTHTYDNKTLPWPSEKSERFRFTKREKYDSPHYEANSFAVAEHGGTHLDAPRHFKAGGGSVADIPLSKLIGHSIVINATKRAGSNRDLQINESDFKNHETSFGEIPQNSIILLYTGTKSRAFSSYCELRNDLRSHRGISIKSNNLSKQSQRIWP